MILLRPVSLLIAVCLPHMGIAQDLRLPSNAVATYQDAGSPDTHVIATGPWAGGAIPHIVAEGTVAQNAWKIAVAGLTTLQVLQPLRDQLTAAGYTEVFTCVDDTCGGFDFRFAIDVLPPPKMQVNLGNFRYWVGVRETTAAGPDHIVLLISQTARAAYIQIDRVSNAGQLGAIPRRGAAVGGAHMSSPDMVSALATVGHSVLDDLSFLPGSADLADGPYASLNTLAGFLRAHPDLQVALVGHTDSAGSLADNITLSKRRANAVRKRLIDAYGISADQIAAEGMGYLAPVGTNLTAAGRDANRRVEAIVTNTN